MRIAYVVSRFPKVSETFITREINVLEELGEQIDIYALVRSGERVVHPEAMALVERARYGADEMLWVLASQFWWLLRRPRRYLGSWREAVRINMGSIGFLARGLITVPIAAAFARRIHSEGNDHVHAHWGTHPALAALVIARLTDLPYSVTVHAHDLYEDTTGLVPKLRAASHVVTISEFNRVLLEQLAPDLHDHLHVVRCGADLTLFDRATTPAETTASPSAKITIVCVGSLDDYKGHVYLVDACADLVARGIAVQCRIIGEGPERATLIERIGRRSLGDVVTLVGRLASDEVRAELAAADVFVLPSVITATGKMEGIPVALMEAMASGVPVVASSISGIPELVEDGVTGLLVPPRDAEAIAAAVERLTRSPLLRRELVRAGLERIRSDYDLRRNAQRLRDTVFRSRGDRS